MREDSFTGDAVGSITATDIDSGRFGQVTYQLKGFGAEKFAVDSKTGQISVKCDDGFNTRQQLRGSLNCLDYETRQSYSLIFSASDGGGQVSTTGLTIRVSDVNDNAPKFEKFIRPRRPLGAAAATQYNGYERTVEEGATFFDPPLIVKATDTDGPTQVLRPYFIFEPFFGDSALRNKPNEISTYFDLS